jgi:hypothetical protein
VEVGPAVNKGQETEWFPAVGGTISSAPALDADRRPLPNVGLRGGGAPIGILWGAPLLLAINVCEMIVDSIILLEVGILAVSFGIVMARRGYISAHKKYYPGSKGRLHLGVALIVLGLICIIAGMLVL